MSMLFPPVIRIEPASSCNLRCKHCPTGLGASPKGLMSRNLFLKILTQVENYVSQISTVVLYHGGEPLLNPDIFYFINELKKLKIKKIKMVTNGKLLDKDRIIKVISSGLDEIEISLDGLSVDDSNGIRRRSDASEILESVTMLNNIKTESRNNLKVTISTTQFVDDYRIDFTDIGKSPIPIWLEKYLEKGISIKSNWAVQWPGGHPRSSQVVYEETIEEKPKKCSLLDETITIRSNGDVVVCCYDLTSLKVMGNVEKNSIIEILESQEYREFKGNFSKKIYSEPCNSCAVVTGNKFLGKSLLLIDS